MSNLSSALGLHRMHRRRPGGSGAMAHLLVLRVGVVRYLALVDVVERSRSRWCTWVRGSSMVDSLAQAQMYMYMDTRARTINKRIV